MPRPGVPDLPAPTPAETALLSQALDRHLAELPEGVASRQPALLPVLHHIQDTLGHVPPPLVPEIARALNLSRAEVHGVITYYHHFRTAAPGRHVVQICQAEACRANGATGLMARAAQRLGCPEGGTRADGAVSLEATYCLGLCATGPAALVDDRLVSRLTPERLESIAGDLEKSS